MLDRGFMFGDGVYEVIPVYAGKAFTLDRHLARLDNSLGAVRIPNPMGIREWKSLIGEAITRSSEDLASAYVQVTRGLASHRSHIYPENPEPTVLVMVSPAPQLKRDRVDSLEMITLDDFRWSRGHIKTTSLIAAGMLKNEAVARGADDAILVRDGHVTEATASNVFLAVGGKLVTPPKNNVVLHGITRDLVIELAVEGGLEVVERPVSASELDEADEIFITSSTHEAWPVGRLNGNTIGNGEGGVLWQEVDRLFQSYKAAVSA
ncbi:MAG: aminotransferase class IV [Gammaproteobacteria bacterium]|nr:aminotransferase class IV [Gammaproteobacteria bacterium]